MFGIISWIMSGIVSGIIWRRLDQEGLEILHIRLLPDRDVHAEKIIIGKVPDIVVKPKKAVKNAPGVLWFYGGGYITGMKEMKGMKGMVYVPRAIDLVYIGITFG